LAKLNEENMLLHKQLTKSRKEAEELQGQVLLDNQIIDELKSKEKERTKEQEEKEKELIENLVKKEYMLQCYEKRYKKIEVILLKYSIKNEDIAKQLNDMQMDVLHHVYKSNLLVEKNGKDMMASLQKVCFLEASLEKLKNESEEKTCVIKKLKKNIQTLEEKVNVNEVEKEIVSVKEASSKLKEERDCLFSLNSKLTEALQAANLQIESLLKKKMTSACSSSGSTPGIQKTCEDEFGDNVCTRNNKTVLDESCRNTEQNYLSFN
jgi:hypothetical protein